MTVTTSVAPPTDGSTCRVESVAPAIGEQLPPPASQDDQEYAYDVGAPDQVPADALSVLPTS